MVSENTLDREAHECGDPASIFSVWSSCYTIYINSIPTLSFSFSRNLLPLIAYRSLESRLQRTSLHLTKSSILLPGNREQDVFIQQPEMSRLRNMWSITEDNIETGTATPESTEKQRELPPVEDLPEYMETGKIELPAAYCSDKLGFAFSDRRKWLILTVIFIVQMSMNFNASIYGNAVVALKEEFGITTQTAMLGQMMFLVAYGLGSEGWAPWSEEFGRKPIMQLSLLFVNIWQIPCALSPSFGGILACRLLGGLSSAGGSVTLGMY